MDDLDKYISKRKKKSKYLRSNFDKGYEAFKLGVILKQLRESEGLTQERLAKMLHTKRTAISRIENHAEDIRLTTLAKYAKVLGGEINIAIRKKGKTVIKI